MGRPVLVLTGRQRPHEVLLLAWSLVFGVAGIASAPAPGSVTALVPHWEVVAWSTGLAVSGAVGLVGCWWRRSTSGLWLELAGMLFGSAATLVYCASVIAAAGWRGLFGAGLIAAWMAANLWRAGQIRRDLKEW